MITFGALYAAFRGLRKKASAGADGVTYEEYERGVAGNIQTLHERLKNGKYQAQPLRRVNIPKENGKQRPISIPALEDKIVQKATVEILNAIYEQDFLNCSYGFRPGREQHQALDEVRRVICTRPTEWVLEIDITAYFDSIVRKQLMEMIEKRVRDGSVLRLIRKWIQVGVIEEGRLLVSETGTGQGQTISPLLANIYLHGVLDEWFENEVKPCLRGGVLGQGQFPQALFSFFFATFYFPFLFTRLPFRAETYPFTANQTFRRLTCPVEPPRDTRLYSARVPGGYPNPAI